MTEPSHAPEARPQVHALTARVADAVPARRSQIIELSHAIHADPEPAFEERHAARRVADAIRGSGFEVEHPAASLATAVRGRLVGGRGADGPSIGILVEDDALPGLSERHGYQGDGAEGDVPGDSIAAARPAGRR